MVFINKMRYLTLSGAKRHRFDDGSDPPSQPSKFLGRCTAEFSTEKSWLNKKPAVIKQLLRVLESGKNLTANALIDFNYFYFFNHIYTFIKNCS